MSVTRRAALFGLLGIMAMLWAPGAGAVSKEECVVSLESGQVSRKKGQLRAAREQFVACAQEGCPAIVRSACADWLEQVEASTPSVVLEAHGNGGASVVDVRVTMDDAPLVDRIDGRSIPIDPGEHRFRFESMKGVRRELRVVIPEGQKNFPVVADFAEPKPPSGPSAADREREERARAAQSRRTVGFIVGGIGVAALAGGTVFGVLALSANGDAVCPSPCPRTDANGATPPKLANARQADDRANSLAWVSDIGLGVGIVGIAVGTYLVLTARAPPSHPGVEVPRQAATLVPAPLPHGGAVVLEEAF
jgi:hypothetical protein